MKLNEFMFLISVRVRSSSEPAGRTETFASTRERSLLHLGVRDAELDDRLPQELEEPLRLVGRANVGSGDDLDERRAAAVVVDERGFRATDASGASADVDDLGSVFLQVRSHDPDHTVAVRSW